MSIHAKISASGRISLPAAIRKRLGLENGGDIVIEETDSGIIIRSTAHAIEQARAKTKRLLGTRPGTSLDDFIATKRQDARLDGA